MRDYLALLSGRKVEIKADSLYAAKQKAVAELRPSKRDMGLLVVVPATKVDMGSGCSALVIDPSTFQFN